MRKTILPILCLALLTSCSNENGDTAKSREDFQKALAAFNEAQQGYLGSHATSSSNDLSAYRQTQLSQAASDFKSLLNVGSDSQRLDTAVLLADAQSSMAEHLARQAMSNWADVALRGTALTNQLLAVVQAASRAAWLDVDFNAPLQKLHDEQQAAGSGIGDLEEQAKRLQAAAAQDQEVIDGLQSRSDSDRTRDQTLRRQAFGKEGSAQDDLYRQANQADLNAISEFSSLQKQTAEMDVCLSELAIINKQIALRRAAAQGIENEIADFQAQQKMTRQRHEAALADQDKAVQRLEKLTGDIANDYADNVQAPLTNACAMAHGAVDALDSAKNYVAPDQSRQYKFNRLVKSTILSSILARQIYAAGGYRRLLEPMATQSVTLMPGVTTFTDAYQEARKVQDSLAAAAKAEIAKGITLATQLQSNDEKAADLLAQLQDYIRGIDDAIAAAPPATAPAAAPADSPQ